MKGSFLPETSCGKAPLILAGAEMDFPTAPVIREALSKFAANGIYGFTLPDDAYLNAVCFWLKTYRGWDVSPDWIVPTLGTVYALSTAVRAFTSPGDGVIVLFPSYYRHDRAVLRNGRRVVPCQLQESDGRYTLNADALAEASFPSVYGCAASDLQLNIAIDLLCHFCSFPRNQLPDEVVSLFYIKFY